MFYPLIENDMNQDVTLANNTEDLHSLLDAFVSIAPNHQQKHDFFFMLPDNVKNDPNFANNIMKTQDVKDLIWLCFQV